MKKIFFTLLAITIFLFSSNLYAGCGGVCLSTETTYQGWNSNTIYSAYLDQNVGSVSMYATYSSCCLSYFGPDMILVWHKDGMPFDTTDINDAVNSTTTFTVSEPGLYEVFFINYQGEGYGCGKVMVLRTESLQSEFAIISTEGDAISNDEPGDYYFKVYPNPVFNDYFYIEYPKDITIFSIEIYTAEGKQIDNFISNTAGFISNYSAITIINTLNYPTGMYFIRINSSESVIITRKVSIYN